MKPVIDLHPSWEVSRRTWDSDFVIVLCVVSFVFALLGGLVTYRITHTAQMSRQRLVDLSHAVYNECWKRFETDRKCNEIADVVLGERED